MDYFDLAADHDGVLANAFKDTKTRFCVVSFTSDWLYPTRESRAIVQALNAVAANVSFVEIESDKGHDAFLLHEPELFDTVRGFLEAAKEKRGLPSTREEAGDDVAALDERAAKRLTYPQPRIDLLLIAGHGRARRAGTRCRLRDGELLKLLEEKKQVDGRGVELSQSGVNFCVAKGLSVIQGDADHDLVNYPDQAFDYAILSQTLQATRHPKAVLAELLRIARHAIVSFPNFGHWRIRRRSFSTAACP